MLITLRKKHARYWTKPPNMTACIILMSDINIESNETEQTKTASKLLTLSRRQTSSAVCVS